MSLISSLVHGEFRFGRRIRCVGRPGPFVGLPFGFGLGDAVSFLDAADELILFPRDLFPIVVGEAPPLFSGCALDLLPLAFNLIPVHGSLLRPAWSPGAVPLWRFPSRRNGKNPVPRPSAE